MKIVYIFILSIFLVSCSALKSHEEGVELAPYMAALQRYSHKLGLSVENNNIPLSDFYLHEIEEIAEDLIEDVPVYDEQPIGKLVKDMLVPAIENLASSVDSKPADFKLVKERYGQLIASCNGCHMASEHGFIEVTIPDSRVNPYNQKFQQ